MFSCWLHFLLLFTYSAMSDFLWPLWTTAHQTSLSFTIYWILLKLTSLTWGFHPTISSSVISFLLPSIFSSIRVFLMSQFFTSGGKSIGALTSASVLPINMQDGFPLRLTGLITFQSKVFSRVFSDTTVQTHQFFSNQPSVWSNSHTIHDYWKKQSFD